MVEYDKNYEDERIATPTVIKWLNKILGLTNIIEVSKTLQKEMGVDLIGQKYNKDYLIENKIRFTEYDDVLIETISNMNTLSPGWIYVSKADLLAYPFCINGIISKGYVFKLPRLQEWWNKYGQFVKYPIKYGKTSDLYKTQNVAVPEQDIPLDCVVFHPNYGLLQPIGENIDSSNFR